MTLNEKRTEDCAIEKEKEAAKQRERAFSKDSPPPPYENSVNDPPDNIVSIQENHV